MIRQGDILNDTYLIKEQLGAGGGGIVYRAYHQRLKTDVVVKQIKDEVKGHLEGRAEADVLKRLRHSHLPRVYDFLEIDGDVYTVMDYIPGSNLEQALEQRKRFPQKLVLQWARELADALAYLHGMAPPIIHSDIKPANIMLQPDGHVCLIDFNISLAFDQSKRTSAGVSAGFSPPEQYHSRDMYRQMSGAGYAPPPAPTPVFGSGDTETLTQGETELCQTETLPLVGGAGQRGPTENKLTEPLFRANAQADIATPVMQSAIGADAATENILDRVIGRGIDERSDIYSLGATLYALLTGIRPNSRYWEMLPIVEACKRVQPHAEISEGLAFIVQKMIALDPDMRYQSGMELKHALDNIFELDNEYRKYKSKQRARRTAIVALFAVSAGLLASGWTVMQKERGNEYNREVLEAREAIAAQEYERAGELILSAQSLMAERIDAYEVEMQRLYALGRYDECIHYGAENINSPVYTVTTEADRNSLANMFYLLGNAYYETADYKNAVKSFELAIQNQGTNSVYYRDLAISLAKQGNISDAEKTLKDARALGIGEDSVFMTEGEIAYAKQDYARAVELFRQVIATTDSNEVLARTVLLCADAYQRLDSEYDQEQIAFLETYEHAIGSRGAQLTEMLAEAYARNGAKGKSIQKFEELIEKGYGTYRIYENLAILQQESNDLTGSAETLATLDDLYPNRYETYKRLTFLEADIQSRKENNQRDYHRMQEYYEKAKELCNTDDVEMQRLAKLMADIRAGGWL